MKPVREDAKDKARSYALICQVSFDDEDCWGLIERFSLLASESQVTHSARSTSLECAPSPLSCVSKITNEFEAHRLTHC